MKLPKDLRRPVRTATKNGWEYVEGGKHARLVKKGHGFINLVSTPSDQRSINNTLAQMRREGAIP